MYHRKFLDLIVKAETGDERSLQRQIGPSGLGQDCWHCLGCELAQIPKQEDDKYLWSRAKGHVMHGYMQHLLEEQNRAAGKKLWFPERKVYVGDIGDMKIKGTADAYDVEAKTVVDFKFPGDKKMALVAKGHIDPTYEAQPHLYGLGYENEGIEVKSVLVLFLPIASPKLEDAIPYYRPYDRAKAETVMKRANDIYALIQRDGAEQVIPRLKRKPLCWDCPKYPL